MSRCPAPGALELTARAGNKVRTVSPYLFPVVLLILFYLVIGLGMVTDNWKSKIPYEEYQRLFRKCRRNIRSGRPLPLSLR